MKKILVTGSNGQLGSELKDQTEKYKKFSIEFTDIDELDITNNEQLHQYFKNADFEYIINCAAYTAVDKAESESDIAYLINDQSVKNLINMCSTYDIKLVQISTDYVFDGKNYRPYNEGFSTNPQSVYGMSKLAGEIQILESKVNAIIIRTSWLYSKYGNNFVKTIHRLASEKNELNVVYDQIGSPTNAEDLAQAILEIIHFGNKQDFENKEIFHYSNEGVCSWYDFALKITELKKLKCNIVPIESKDFPTPAPRPHFSVLNKEKIKTHFNLKIPHWEESLLKMLEFI